MTVPDGRSFVFRPVEPARPIVFDREKCAGCNRCVDACPIDLLLPAGSGCDTPEAGYPDECWYCGCCAMECPHGAITLRHPLMNRARWIDKSALTGN